MHKLSDIAAQTGIDKSVILSNVTDSVANHGLGSVNNWFKDLVSTNDLELSVGLFRVCDRAMINDFIRNEGKCRKDSASLELSVQANISNDWLCKDKDSIVKFTNQYVYGIFEGDV